MARGLGVIGSDRSVYFVLVGLAINLASRVRIIPSITLPFATI
jgi:hypothetical protein